MQNDLAYQFTIMSQTIRQIYELKFRQCNNFSLNCYIKINNFISVSVRSRGR